MNDRARRYPRLVADRTTQENAREIGSAEAEAAGCGLVSRDSLAAGFPVRKSFVCGGWLNRAVRGYSKAPFASSERA